MIERTTATKVCNEVVVKKSILLDHLPTNFDVAFRRARETLMMEANLYMPPKTQPSAADGILDPVPSEGKTNVALDQDVQTVHKEECNEAQNNNSAKQPLATANDGDHPIWGSIAKLGLKGTTDRTGGEGDVLGNEATPR